MENNKPDTIKSKVRVNKKLKSIHPVVQNIANNLAEIDIIQHITVSEEFIKASSEVTPTRNKIPITQLDHPTAVGISLIPEIEFKDAILYKINYPVKGYGSAMVDAIMRALPDDWKAVVVIDRSGGFVDKMMEKYSQIIKM